MNYFERLQTSREANQKMKVYFLEIGKDNQAKLTCFGSYLEVLSLYNTAACLLIGYTQRMLELDTSITYEHKGSWGSIGLPAVYLESLRLGQTPDDQWADELGYAVWRNCMVFFGSTVSGVRNSQKAMGLINLRFDAGHANYKLPRTTLVGSTHFTSLHRLMQRALALAKNEGVPIANATRLLAFTKKLKEAETMLVLEDDEVKR